MKWIMNDYNKSDLVRNMKCCIVPERQKQQAVNEYSVFALLVFDFNLSE